MKPASRPSPFLPLFATAALLWLDACHSAPQTAEELRARLPHRFTGEAHWQGETSAQRIRLETRDLTPRDAHTLAFEGVAVQLLDAQGGVTADRFVAARGVISAPGLEIRVDDLGAPGGEDILKPGTFQGKLSQDLQSIEASWTNGFGGKGSLKLKAE